MTIKIHKVHMKFDMEYPHLGVLLHFSAQSLRPGNVQAQLAYAT